MAVKLRLTRKGKKKQPFYRIVATDSRSRRDGKYIEKIGYYNPLTTPAEIVIDEEKAFYWLKNGAIPSETVKSLFSQKGIMLKWHYIRDGHEETKAEEEYKKWQLLQLERQKQEDALAAQVQREQKSKTTDEESVREAEEEVVSEMQPQPSPETQPDSSAEQIQQPVESQPDGDASKQNLKESEIEEQKNDTQAVDEPQDKKE